MLKLAAATLNAQRTDVLNEKVSQIYTPTHVGVHVGKKATLSVDKLHATIADMEKQGERTQIKTHRTEIKSMNKLHRQPPLGSKINYGVVKLEMQLFVPKPAIPPSQSLFSNLQPTCELEAQVYNGGWSTHSPADVTEASGPEES